jgi:hypothetical protein
MQWPSTQQQQTRSGIGSTKRNANTNSSNGDSSTQQQQTQQEAAAAAGVVFGATQHHHLGAGMLKDQQGEGRGVMWLKLQRLGRVKAHTNS